MPLTTAAAPRRLLALVGLTLTALLALATPASAHAELRSSTPADGAVVAVEPHQVTLVFSEDVTLRLSSVQVIGPDGRRLDSGTPQAPHTDAERITVPLAPDPHPGTYVVDWRATASDDGHATAGTLSFSVGAPSRPAAVAVHGFSAHDRVTDAVLDTAIWLGFAGLALLVGNAVVRRCRPRDGRPADTRPPGARPADTRPTDARPADADPPGARPADIDPPDACPSDARPSGDVAEPRWPAALGWAVLLAGTVVQLLVYGPATQGASAAKAFDRSLLSATLSTREGHALVARIVLLALVAAVGEALLRRRRGDVPAAVLAIALAATWSMISHAASGTLVPLALVVTTAHVTAMAVWAGGLFTLAVLLLRADGGRELAVTTARFSRLALGSVAVLAVTGVYQAVREVGSFGEVTGTSYGRLLLVKTAVVVAVIGVAAVTRSRTDRRSGPEPRSPRRLVLLELAGVTVVLIVTVLLISTPPARTAATPPPSVPAPTAGPAPAAASVPTAPSGLP